MGMFKCLCVQQYKMRNVTEDVKKIVRFVQENCEKVGTRYGRTPLQNRLTLNMLVDIFIGKTDNRTGIARIFQFWNLHICKKEWSLFDQGQNLPRCRQECMGWVVPTPGIMLTACLKGWFWTTSWWRISTLLMAAKLCVIFLLDPKPPMCYLDTCRWMNGS